MTVNDKWLNTKWDVRNWTKAQKIAFQEECFRLGYGWGLVRGQKIKFLNASAYCIGSDDKSIARLEFWSNSPMVDFDSPRFGVEKKWEDMFPAKVKNDKNINHQDYYGGDNVYEVMKIIEHYNLGFKLGNVLKYVIRAGKKDPTKEIEDLEKAKVYLERQIEYLQSQGV